MPSATNPEQIGTVLVVDDDSDARERLGSVFEKAGYRAFIAADAMSAVRESITTRSAGLLLKHRAPLTSRRRQ